MGITDIDISTELETNVPSIKYRGNEGPKSPQEEKMIMQQQMNEMDQIKNQEAGDEEMLMADSLLKNEYLKYVFEMEEQGMQPMSFQQFRDQIMSEARQPAAFGGIMGLDGRRKYGIGSSLKKFVRKIIPNEVSELAVKAAPFVAPFNAPLAGLMAGVGSFDQTGRIGSSLKAGLGTYAQGKIMSGIGGGGYQGGKTMNPFNKSMYTQFTSPIGTQSGIGKVFKENFTDKLSTSGGSMASGADGLTSLDVASGEAPVTLEQMTNFNKVPVKNLGETGSILSKIKDLALDNKLLTGLAAGTLGATALMGNMKPDEIQDLQRGEGLDLEGIRTEVIEAMKDPSGEKLKAIRIKYPFLGNRDTKDMTGFAMGGRIGMAEGGIMDLGGMEKDYRAEGGFVPIGKEEKADDVPARLSVNEFVMTADAVRGMGDGDIDLGAKRMENLMGSMENKKGAQQMFQTSQRLGDIV